MKILNIILCTSLSATPFLANAENLKIANSTYYDLSFAVNKVCSNEFGTVTRETIKIIPEKEFKKACEANSTNCFTEVYDHPNCKGNKISEVGFDISLGVTYLSGNIPTHISVTGCGFNLFFTTSLKK